MLSASVQSDSCRKLEVHSARIILLHCGLNVKLGQRNFSRPPIAQIVERGSDDGVVSNLKLVTILKYQDGARLVGDFLLLPRGMAENVLLIPLFLPPVCELV